MIMHSHSLLLLVATYLVITLIQRVDGQLPLSSSCAVSVPSDGISAPVTWNVQKFYLVISDVNYTTLASNLTSSTILVNGTSPGPRLDVDEFDWVEVTVTSQLASSTSITAIHWHGLNLYRTPYSDGVAGISQCGQQPNTTVVYRFCAYPAGTHYYHGSNNLQGMSGLYGAFVVHPTNLTANATDAQVSQDFAQDLTWIASDEYIFNINNTLSPLNTVIPSPQSIIVNGHLSNTSVVDVDPASRVLIRLINAGSLRSYMFSIDGVAMTVLGLDGTSIQPYVVHQLRLSVGQRATISVEFSTIANFSSVFYRVSAIASSSLVVTNSSLSNAWFGIIRLDSNSTAQPADGVPDPQFGTFSDINGLQARALSYQAIGTLYYGDSAQTVPQPTTSLTLNIISELRNGVTRLIINNATLDTTALNSLEASKTILPFLYAQIRDISAALVPNVTQSLSAVIPSSDIAQYALSEEAVINIMILNADSVQHSFHLHGHSFWIVATSDNPLAEHIRDRYIVRDTVGIPANGWALLRFVASNPGSWLLSSASDWYFSQGVAVAFLESTFALNPNFVALPTEQLHLCNSSIQEELAGAIAEWHDLNDPVTYESSALSQTSRALIGGLIGGISALFVVIIMLCTVFGIRKDDSKTVLSLPRSSPTSATSAGNGLDEDPNNHQIV